MPNDFIPSQEEMQRVADEISLLRRDFQTGIAALSRIEKRLRAAFPAYPAKKAPRPATGGEPPPSPLKTGDELRTDFEALLAATKERGDVGFESTIGAMFERDVIALAHELGIGSLKTSARKAREGVRKRVQESILLSYEGRPASATKPPETALSADTPQQT